eukprot:370931-Rhodomonas_salina.5
MSAPDVAERRRRLFTSAATCSPPPPAAAHSVSVPDVATPKRRLIIKHGLGQYRVSHSKAHSLRMAALCQYRTLCSKHVDSKRHDLVVSTGHFRAIA